MKPLSARRRWFYLIALTFLFSISLPVALLYSSGYRYKAGFGLVKTGGIYLSVPYTNAVVSLNGVMIGTSGFLNKSFYIDDLAPSTYVVHVEHEDSHPWYRTLIVEPQLVTRADIVLIPESPETVRLTRGGTTSSTTRAVSPERYDSYVRTFAIPATSTTREGQGSLTSTIVNGDVYVHWIDTGKLPPDNFCVRPSECVQSFLLEDGAPNSYSVGFFGEGVVYATREGGIFFSEIDVRDTPVAVALYPRRAADMRVIEGDLIIKEGNILYQIERF